METTATLPPSASYSPRGRAATIKLLLIGGLVLQAPVVLYTAAILRSPQRAGIVAALLAGVYGILHLVLRMENYRLLAGTATLFALLAAVMCITRNVDWDGATPESAEDA